MRPDIVHAIDEIIESFAGTVPDGSGAGTVVRHIRAPVAYTCFKSVSASCPAKVVYELILRHISPARVLIVLASQSGECSTCERQCIGEQGHRCSQVWIAGIPSIVHSCKYKLIYEVWREDVALVQLAFVLGLIAGDIKKRIEGGRYNWLAALYRS